MVPETYVYTYVQGDFVVVSRKYSPGASSYNWGVSRTPIGRLVCHSPAANGMLFGPLWHEQELRRGC